MRRNAIGHLGGVAASAALLTLAPLSTQAATWVPIQGNVRTGNGAPVCALVLANGQYMFSCDGNGTYNLNVPLDEQGQVTLFAFADGFAPYRVTAVPAGLPAVVRAIEADPDSALIGVSRYGPTTCYKDNWVYVLGEIHASGGGPLCALALANGQHMFTCGATPGEYQLAVPLDENGEVTLFAFADGFQPYSDTFSERTCEDVLFMTENGVEISAHVNGPNWPFPGDCQVEVTARNTTSITKDIGIFLDAWDPYGEKLGIVPVSFYLRAESLATKYTWISYKDNKTLDCSPPPRWEVGSFWVDDVYPNQ